MKTRYAALALTIASCWTTACASAARSPEPVPLDRVECARCRMLISNDRGGGQIVSAHDDTRFYDDIACLAADWSAHHADDARAFVHVSGGDWSDATTASYAAPPAERTAMGSGFAAFRTADDARAADRAGRALTWNDLLAQTGERR